MADFNLTAVLQLVDNSQSVVEKLQLRVDRITHSIGRNPVIITIPGIGAGSSGDGIPKIFALDFGTLTENIILSGILPDNDPESLNPTTFPNHKELANAVRTWWRYAAFADSFEPRNGIFLDLDEGPGHGVHRYRAIIQGLICERVGGETKWTFKLTLAITAFPESEGPMF